MCCLFCFTFFRRIPRQQCLERIFLGQVCVLGCFHQPGQVAVRVQAIFNGGLDQAEHYCAAGGTLRGIGEQEVLSVNDKGLDTSLCTVIGALQQSVFQVVSQVRPLLLQISEGFAQSRLRCRRSGICPCKYSV